MPILHMALSSVVERKRYARIPDAPRLWGIGTTVVDAPLVKAYGCGSKFWLSQGSPPLLQTFVAGPLLQTLVADLCVEYCSLEEACRGGVCRRTSPSVTNVCREMAAQACYKANVFSIRCQICIHVYGLAIFSEI